MRRTELRSASVAVLLVLLMNLAVRSVQATEPPPDPVQQERLDVRTLRFDHLSVGQGLSHKAVTAVVQDARGFMWFGTQSGLNRYDGYEMRTFKYDPDDPGSLSHNWVAGLLVDRSGALWVGTFGGGLNRYDSETETFAHFQHDPNDPHSLSHDFVGPLHEDASGTIWVGTEGGGLNRFDRASGTFRRFLGDPNDTAAICDTTNAVRAIHEDRRGQLWIGTWGGGICLLDRENGRFQRFPLNTEAAPQTVLGLYEDRSGVLWVGTEHAGLIRIDQERGRLQPVALAREESLAGTPIASMYEDSRGIFWLGTWGKGLCQFDPDEASVTCAHFSPYDPGSLRDDGVSVVYEDRSGVLWVGTWNGLSRLDEGTARVTRYRHNPTEPASLSDGDVQTLYADGTGTIWAGTWSGGLNRLDVRSGRFRHYRYRPNDARSLSNDNVQAILKDRAGALWIGTWGGGLVRFDAASNAFTRYVHDPADPSSLHSNSVLALHEDRDGVLWVGTWDGLSRRDAATGVFHRIPDGPQASGGPGHVEVRSIFQDSDGVLWIATRGDGLGRLDPAEGMFRFFKHDPSDPYSLGHNTVWDLHEDREGGLWVATGGGGLNRFDRHTTRFTRYTVQHTELPDNVIYSIVEDGIGHLWLGTEGGLTRFSLEDEQFVNYEERAGLRSCGFTTAAFYDDTDGTLYVGCADGFAAFRPDEILPNVIPPSVVITDLKLFGRSIGKQPGGPLGGSVSESREVVFRHNENDLSFEFVALHFANSGYNQYAYRLDAYDSDWRYAGMQRSATYTNLDPGTYVLHVKAANSDGVWNEEGAMLRVVIRPPWWRTWPAYILYVLVFFGALGAASHLGRKRLVRREREAAQITENALRAEAAEARAHALQSEFERQTQELEHARHVQLSMLPETVPQHPLAKLAAAMQTAAEVGGDYYDFSSTRDGTLNFIIGDATGHGVQAGTMVTAMKSLWSAFSEEPDLEELLSRSTEALRRMRLPKLYMAVAVGRIDGGSLELVGAGMPPALVFRAATGKTEQVPLKGVPMGSPVPLSSPSQRVALEPDDVVVLMSDGFPELFNGDGEMLGYDRALQFVAESIPGRSPDEIIAHLMDQVSAWRNGGPPNDDVTFIVLQATDVVAEQDERGDGAASAKLALHE